MCLVKVDNQLLFVNLELCVVPLGMYHFRLLILLIAFTSFLFLIMGLIKPWIMLWWEDVQNRKKVIKLYGSIGLIFLTLYVVLQYWV